MSPPSPPWEDVSASQIPGAEAPFSRAGGPGADSGLGVEWGEGCKGVSFLSAAPALNSQSRANPDRDSHRGDGERRGDLHPVTHPSTAYSPAGVGRGSWSPSVKMNNNICRAQYLARSGFHRHRVRACAKSLSRVRLLVTLEPTRPLCPWDSPGKNTGVGCHARLQGTFPTQREPVSLR